MARIMRSTTREAGARAAGTSISWEEVSNVAYELFERRGRVHGHDVEDWVEAQRIVRQRGQGGNGR